MKHLLICLFLLFSHFELQAAKEKPKYAVCHNEKDIFRVKGHDFYQDKDFPVHVGDLLEVIEEHRIEMYPAFYRLYNVFFNHNTGIKLGVHAKPVCRENFAKIMKVEETVRKEGYFKDKNGISGWRPFAIFSIKLDNGLLYKLIYTHDEKQGKPHIYYDQQEAQAAMNSLILEEGDTVELTGKVGENGHGQIVNLYHGKEKLEGRISIEGDMGLVRQNFLPNNEFRIKNTYKTSTSGLISLDIFVIEFHDFAPGHEFRLPGHNYKITTETLRFVHRGSDCGIPYYYFINPSNPREGYALRVNRYGMGSKKELL